jgi:hypothetical protein
MKKPRTKKNVVPRFDAHERERLAKMSRTLGSDNTFEAEAARGRIDSLLQKYGKTWSDLAALLDADPEMPKQLRNRLSDNWRPLVAIADSLGMGEEAREAAVAFARAFQDADVRILALIDIRRVFDANDVDRMTSKALLDALHDLADSDWTEFRGLRGDQQPHKLKAGELAGMLREFGIRPRVIWPLKRTAKSISARGYHRSEFEQAWKMYCVDEEAVTPSRSGKVRAALQLAGDDT